MGRLRVPEIQARPTEGLDLIGLTVDAFQRLFQPFEAAFQTHMAEWRFDGQPRTARGNPTDQSGLLPAPEDRLLRILVCLKTYPFQVVQESLFGMGQSTAHRRIRVLLGPCGGRAGGCSRPVREGIGPPSQGGRGGRGRGGRAYPDVIDRVHSTPAAFTPVPAFSLLGTMARNATSSALRNRLHGRTVSAARKHAPQ